MTNKFKFRAIMLISMLLSINQVWGVDYEKFTSSTITEGDYVICSETTAMSNTVSSDRMSYETVTVTNNVITDPKNAIVWHIAASGDYWTLYNADVQKYAASTGAKNKIQLVASQSDDKLLWSCAKDASQPTFDFTNKQNTTNGVNATLRYNSNYGFACYATGTGSKLTLYKKKAASTFTVTYSANGAESGSVPTDSHEYNSGDPVTVLGNTGNLALTNKKFGGWNTKDDGTGTNYQAGATFNISANTTLYAKWNDITYTDYLTECSSNPSVSISSNFSTFSYVVGGGPSTAQSFTVSGTNLEGSVTVSATSDYEVCLTENGSYSSSVTLNQGAAATLSATTVYIRLKSGLEAGAHNGTLSVSSSNATTQQVSLTGSVTAVYDVVWYVNGVEHKTITNVADGTVYSSLDLPTDPDNDVMSFCEANKFMGWATATISGTTTAGEVQWVNTSSTITSSNHEFYAVYAKGATSTNKYDAVTVEPADWAGTYVMVVNNKVVELNGAKTSEMKTSETDFSQTTEYSSKEVVVAKHDSYYSIYLNEKSMYLGDGSSSTSLTMNATYSSTTYDWSLSVGSINSRSRTDRYLRANSSGKVASYLSTEPSTTNVTLYKKNIATYSEYRTACSITTWSVKYDANGKDFGGNLPATVTGLGTTESFSVPSDNYGTNANYTQIGWNTDKNATEGISSIDAQEAGTTITLYAIWQGNVCTVTWNNRGTETHPSGTVRYGDLINTPSLSACGEDYPAVGWTTVAPTPASPATQSGWASKPDTKNAGAAVTIEGNVTYYAVYSDKGEVTPTSNYTLLKHGSEITDGNYLYVNLYTSENRALTNYAFSNNHFSPHTVIPENEVISSANADEVWQLTKQLDNGYTFLNTQSGNKYLSQSENNLITVSNAGDATSFIVAFVNETTDQVQIKYTGNYILGLYYENTSYYFGLHSTSVSSTGKGYLYKQMVTDTKKYYSNPDCTTYFDITNITVNNGDYGSVSPTEVLNIPDQSVVTVSSNTFTVNGTTVTATPTESDAQYTYAFTSWSNIADGDKITADKSDIVANFTRTVNNYSVTATLTNVTAGTAFPAQLSYGGSFSTTISANTGYNLPASISVSGATSNWNASTGELTISDVTGAVTVTISGQIKTYAVTLAKNEDWGTIDPTALADVNHETAISIDGSDSKILHVGGSTVTATPATNTAQYTYGWTGWTWSPEGATITAATTATANFTRTLNQYTITFKNEDETVLQSGLVNYGETPTYSGATPTKASTAQYTYTFAGWDPAITTVTAAATYTATYTPATRVYNVSTTLTHVTATPAIPATVEYGGSITSIISADGGYNLPNDITVTGATISTWNKSTGEMKLTNVTGDVSIKIEAELSGYKTLYLKPNSNWKSYSAKFALYDITHSKFTGEYMTAVGCETDIYSGEVPNSCVKVIFCRMDPSKGIDWDGKWNQTGDLNLDGTLYTITENSENWSAGSWSTFTPTTFTVSFNKNNGEGDDKASITNIGCQGSALLPTNDWTRTGYDANGWNTAADGSGTHYDDGATITDITANIPLYAEWSSNHPGTVTVSGTYHYWEGETIELTASVQYPERLKPSATYTWKRNGVVVEGQTTNVLSIPSCLFDNAGVYTCTVANGGAESTSSNFGVKILAFVLKNAEGSAISTTVLTKPAEGTVVVLPAFNLANENSTYKFCVIDGAGGRFGNDGQMTDKNCTNWAMDKDNDCRILTSGAGNYTFSVDYANIGQPKVSVTYPDHDQAENYPIYFDNSQGWSTDKLYYRIGASTTLCSEAMTLVPGTSRLYTTVTKKYDSFLAWHIGNNAGWTGDNSIYKTKTGDSYAITNSTSFIKSIVGETGVTVTITDQHSTGLSDENNNCEFYETTTTAGLLTHTATVTAPMNGTIQLNWTDITGTAQEATATTAGLAHTCNLTITATPATGYELTSLTVNGNTFTSGTVHVLDADATIAAVFSAAVYSVTLNTNGGTINSGDVTSYTYGVGATLPTDVTKSDADFGGWFAESDFSGERVYSIGDSETGNKEFWALWTYLFAYNCNGGTCSGEYSTTCETYLSVPEGTEMTVTSGTPAKTGYTFDGWQVNGAGEYLHGDDKVTVSQTTELVAHFTAQLVNYTVKHYQQNVDGTYPSSPTDVDNLQAYTGASVTPERKNYGAGFNTPSGSTVTIAGDGSTVVSYQYSRTTHTITWTLDDGFDTQWYKQTYVRYGAQPTYKSSDPATSDCDYERVFVGWLDHKIAWADKVQVAPTGMFQKDAAPTVSGDANYYAVFANYVDDVYSNYATACVKKYVITSFSDVNGNAITADFEQAAAGETVTLTVTTADGWKNKSFSVVKTTNQSTIVEVTDNQFTMPAYDVTVKATFVPVHRVFFHVPSGGCITAPTTIELETSEVVPTLPAPTGTIPGGWTFAGWSLTEVTTESTTMPNLMYSGGYLENDVHVYALYQKAGTETLTFDQFLSGSTYNSAYFVISSLYSTAEHALPNTTVINGSDRIASTTITSVSDGMVTNASEIAATKMLFRKISSTEVQIMNVNNMFLDGKDGKLKLSTTAATWTKGSSGTQANPVRFTINSKALRINSTNEYGHYAASATQVNDTKILAISNNTVYYLTDADCIEKWYVTYEANGGETTCGSGKKVAEGFTICADEPTRDHYTFQSWSDGVSTYAAGAAYSLTKNVTFTAQWTLVQHTVTFKNNGVTLDEGGTRQVGYGTAVGALPQLTEDQAVDCNGRSVIFMGWMEGEIDPREDNPTITYITPSTVIDGDKTYNAVWAEGVEEEVEP